jgi:hypothetical protein
MAHYSYASPDRQSALVVEMNTGVGRCASSFLSRAIYRRRSVGPDGACTSAGWSPDGSWMYFIATVEGQSHLWRQRFPDGQPEQITFGPMEEEGLAVEPTAVLSSPRSERDESAIWIHDGSGERSLSSEGEVVGGLAPPSFAMDGINPLLPSVASAGGFGMPDALAHDGGFRQERTGISRNFHDRLRCVAGWQASRLFHCGAREKSQLWLAPMDRSSPPNRSALPVK